ncbi:uncharacterized protein LOC131067745 [Cryptomeria japonica]|uniref:uncharacterized protein LOC131067745 n=1 Tax=Cryptomeria japonica TaxID=3369 RepID=UPI0025AD0AB4|nr:uncharacterized protein LOC131067745 [Cryptomeria japonica]
MGMMLEEYLETNSNEYEWGPESLSDASTEENPEESNDTIDKAQEIAHMKLQRELEEVRLKRQEAYEKHLRKEKSQSKRTHLLYLHLMRQNKSDIGTQLKKWRLVKQDPSSVQKKLNGKEDRNSQSHQGYVNKYVNYRLSLNQNKKELVA